MTEAASLLPGSPTERKKRKKKKSFKVPGSIGENMRLRSYKHTFPSCADLHLKAPDEVFLEANQIRTHTHTHTNTQTQESALGSVAITSDALIPPPAASL